MILDTLSSIKNSSEDIIENESIKIKTANSIEKLLDQIDFNSEFVPTNNFERLNLLITSLKGSELTSDENQIIKELCHK